MTRALTPDDINIGDVVRLQYRHPDHVGHYQQTSRIIGNKDKHPPHDGWMTKRMLRTEYEAGSSIHIVKEAPQSVPGVVAVLPDGTIAIRTPRGWHTGKKEIPADDLSAVPVCVVPSEFMNRMYRDIVWGTHATSALDEEWENIGL